MIWRKFRKWTGFPVLEDILVCAACGSRLTIGEFPAYDWECPNEWRHS